MPTPAFPLYEGVNGETRMHEHPALKRTDAERAAGVTPVNYAFAPGHVWRYMAPDVIEDVIARTLTKDTAAAIQAAIRVAQQMAGVEVHLPNGAYLIRRSAGDDSQFNGIAIPYTAVFGYAGTGISIRGEGQSTVLYAGDDDMTVIRWSDSSGRLDNLAIDANSHSGVSGLSLIGSDTTDTALAEHIDWNTFTRLSINGCAEGIELESPSAGGCYYNRFQSLRLYNNTRHIRMRDNAQIGGPNGNLINNVVCIGGNCGVWIDGTDTTRLIGVDFEVIAVGTSPCATPTAIYINNVGTLKGFASSDTNIIGCRFEANTQDLDCNNRKTTILGGVCGALPGKVVGTTTPRTFLGGDATQRLDELLFGDAAADGVYLTSRAAAYQAYCQFVGTANVAGSFPFDQDGNLLIQSRETNNNGIQIATGASSTRGLDLRGNGEVVVRAGALTQTVVTVTYSASITIDATQGNVFEISASNGTAFAINAPTNPRKGMVMRVVIYNTSGGALGAITWNAAFKKTVFTAPASGNNRYVEFYYNVSWYQQSASAADVPN